MSIVKVHNIFLIGPMGAGKSTIGRTLAKELKLEFYDSDEVIEERTGANISWIFDVEGAEGFRRREQKVIDELTQKNNIVLATGGLEGRLEMLRDEREPFYEELADVSFETDKLTVKAVANNIVKYIYGES